MSGRRFTRVVSTMRDGSSSYTAWQSIILRLIPRGMSMSCSKTRAYRNILNRYATEQLAHLADNHTIQ